LVAALALSPYVANLAFGALAPLGAAATLQKKAVALKPLAALAISAAAAWKARGFAINVERTLTSGMWSYPPPRNLASDKGASKNLRTVEQGRRS
jgi:hypothetical protein